MNCELRINNLPKWARDHIRYVQTFIGAHKLQELIQIRDEGRQLIKPIGDWNRRTIASGACLNDNDR